MKIISTKNHLLKIFCLFSLLAICQTVWCQAVKIKIIDVSSNTPIENATITTTLPSYYVTNEEGEILINGKDFKDKKLQISVNSLGYESIDTVLTANNSFVLLKMTFNNFLDEVQVVAKPTIINLSLHTLTQKDIKNTFPLLGEKDPMKTLQLLPGVQAAQEGTASIFVRGGNPGENLVLLDGVPIHNSNHFFGLISTINPNIISNINFYKGGFPAQYNDKVSSVIDISTHNYLNDTTKIGIGILSSNISLSRNFLSKKVNVQFAVRSTPLSLIKGAYDRIQNINQVVRNGNNVWFYDVYSKVNVALYKNLDLQCSYFNSYDAINLRNKTLDSEQQNTIMADSTKLKWLSTFYSMSLHHKSGLKYNSKFNTYYSRYSLSNNDGIINNAKNARSLYDYQNEIDEFAINQVFNYFMTSSTSVKAGISYKVQKFNNVSFIEEIVQGKMVQNEKENYRKQQNLLNSFVSLNGLLFGKFLRYDAGINVSNNLTLKATFLEPRINASFQIIDFSVIGTYHKIHQNANLITPENLGLPIQIWLPSFSQPTIVASDQLSLGFLKNMSGGYFSIEGYYKTTQNLVYASQGADLRIVNPESSSVARGGTAKSKGIEFIFNKNMTWIDLKLSYTLSNSRIQFATLNRGKSFLQNTNRTHAINLQLSKPITSKWTTFLLVSYATAYPITIPENVYPSASFNNFTINGSNFGSENSFLLDFTGGDVLSSFLYDLNTVNNYQSKSHFRIDLSLRKVMQKSELSFGVYNLLWRKNPFITTITDHIDNSGNRSDRIYKQTVSLFNFIPFVQYERSF